MSNGVNQQGLTEDDELALQQELTQGGAFQDPAQAVLEQDPGVAQQAAALSGRPDLLQQFQQPERSTIQSIGRALSAFSAGTKGKGQEFFAQEQKLETKRQKALAADALTVNRLLTSDNPQDALKLLGERGGLISQLGGTPDDTNQLKQLIASGPDGVELARAQTQIVIDAARNRGLLAKAAKDKFIEIRGNQAIVQTPDGRIEPRDIPGLAQDPKQLEALRGEARTSISKKKDNIDKVGNSIVSNFGKVQNLLKEVAAGNRQSVPALGTALVKLGDPTSVVSDVELQNALASINPQAALAKLVRDGEIKQSAVDLFSQFLDPKAAATLDTTGILGTARALVTANVPDVQRQMRDVRLQSEFLTQAGRDSIFTSAFDELETGLANLLVPPKPTRNGDRKDRAKTRNVQVSF